jgi:hypothetical protein
MSYARRTVICVNILSVKDRPDQKMVRIECKRRVAPAEVDSVQRKILRFVALAGSESTSLEIPVQLEGPAED